jgi:hypothetical protein
MTASPGAPPGPWPVITSHPSLTSGRTQTMDFIGHPLRANRITTQPHLQELVPPPK